MTDERGIWYLPSPDGEGTMVFNAHPRGQCAGRGCALHGASDHPMRDWPLQWRHEPGKGGTMLRRCKHGQWHDDPDDADFRRMNQAEPWREMPCGCRQCCTVGGAVGCEWSTGWQD